MVVDTLSLPKLRDYIKDLSYSDDVVGVYFKEGNGRVYLKEGNDKNSVEFKRVSSDACIVGLVEKTVHGGCLDFFLEHSSLNADRSCGSLNVEGGSNVQPSVEVDEGADLVESTNPESLNDESSESEEDNKDDSENDIDVKATEGNEIDEELRAARENIRAYKRSKEELGMIFENANKFREAVDKKIGPDGCFLKGPCIGQLLVVVAKDGNNQMFPIA
ncbi:hypothetical protein GH714_010496 [Hevea brasiliensis]|uniref:Uncharacterized protein n=1 Tax=Hevea brasiliensis TaxID=3981 RepID=A0A6A6KKS4_HEVBR|nr:hypothetical protein GH714_010496 [Hevea brasiliensis]